MKKIILLFLVFSISAFSKVLNTAVILEDDSKYSNSYLEVLKSELDKNFAGTNFKTKITKVEYVNSEDVNSKLAIINLDKKIDGVFILTNNSVGEIKNFKGSKFYSVPFGFGKANKALPKNVNYVYSDLNLKNYISKFEELDGVTEVDVFVSNISEENVQKLSAKLTSKKIKVNVFKNNKEQIVESKNPTFLLSFDERNNGDAYSGIEMNREVSKRIRAASLNYMLYKTKNVLGKVVEVTNPRDEMFFNGSVAARIGIYPNLLFLQNISKVQNLEQDKEKLTLKEAIEISLNKNLSLLKSNQDIQTNSYNVKISNSSRLPQLSANMQYNALDDRTTNVKMGSPTNSVNSYLELSQVIFNDQLNLAVKIEKLALDSSRKQYEQQKLNVLYYTASTYINILQLKAQLDVQRSNYALLKETLGIAKLNYAVGAKGLQDVYRLESDVASSLSNIANIQGSLKNQEIYLNTLLNEPLEKSYNYESLKDISDYFVISESFNKNFKYGSNRTKRIENFLVKGAISNSNTLAVLDNNLESKQRELSSNKRERFLPQINAMGKYNKDNVVSPWGKNSNRDFPDEYWQAGIVAKLPLISGGEIYYNSKKIESEIQSLQYNKEDSKNELAKQVLQTYTELLTNSVQSYSTEVSADVAKKNLEIVKNLYSEGTISVTDFLSAQNNALSQELNNVIQNFNLLNSALKLENLYGKSSLLMSSEEKMKVLNQLNEEVEN